MSSQALTEDQLELLRSLPPKIIGLDPLRRPAAKLHDLGLIDWHSYGGVAITHAGETLLATIDAAREDERRRLSEHLESVCDLAADKRDEGLFDLANHYAAATTPSDRSE